MLLGCCVPIEKYELAAGVGYDYAELPAWQVHALGEDELRTLTERKNAVGLPIPRLNAYCPGTPAIVGSRADNNETRIYARKLMKNAAVLGVKTIGVGAPKARTLPLGFDRSTADAQCTEFFKITAEEAAVYGITLLIESVQRGMCNYINTMREAAEMMRRINLPNVRLMADLYHMEKEKEDWAGLKDYMADIGHMHVSTVGLGNARGLYGEENAADCRRAFEAIRAAGYDDTVSIEPDADELSEETMTTALKLMRQACR